MIYDKQTVMLRQEVNYFKAIKKLCAGDTYSTYNT